VLRTSCVKDTEGDKKNVYNNEMLTKRFFSPVRSGLRHLRGADSNHRTEAFDIESLASDRWLRGGVLREDGEVIVQEPALLAEAHFPLSDRPAAGIRAFKRHEPCSVRMPEKLVLRHLNE